MAVESLYLAQHQDVVEDELPNIDIRDNCTLHLGNRCIGSHFDCWTFVFVFLFDNNAFRVLWSYVIGNCRHLQRTHYTYHTEAVDCRVHLAGDEGDLI